MARLQAPRTISKREELRKDAATTFLPACKPSMGKDVTVAVNVGTMLNGKVSLFEPILTFTSTDWSTDQSVTVMADGDADAADEAGTLELLASGGGYDGQKGIVSVAVDDDETARLVVAPSLLNLVEGRAGKVVKVKLPVPPSRGHVRMRLLVPYWLGEVSVSKPSSTVQPVPLLDFAIHAA